MSSSLAKTHHGGPKMPSVFLRPRVWLSRATLDRMLAEGADPHDSPELARRAAQLTSARHRHSLAAAIERTLEEAEHPRRALSPAVPLQRSAVFTARVPLKRLAADLAGDNRESLSGTRGFISTRETTRGSMERMTAEEYAPRGVALVQRLLTDGDSPLYTPYPAGELELAVRRANAALLLR